MTKKEEIIGILEKTDDAGIIIKWDKKWRYPHCGDDAKTCPMLDFMLNTEYRTGTLIFLPDKKNVANLGDRNKN